jgi:hypothetical protein
MNRRRLLQILAALPFAGGLFRTAAAAPATAPFSRVRPGDPEWPSDKAWEELGHRLEGRLIKVTSPLSGCVDAPSSDAWAHVAKELKNPYYLGDEVGLTQTLGWVGAWTTRPSVYAVATKSTSDVVAAVNFARTHNLRLVVKGGGHSFQGTSSAADSLLIWTRPMSTVVLHDAFVGFGCEGQVPPRPAVSVAAGAIWEHVYNEAMVKAGRYVQGGSALTVGVAGLVLGGGFGSLSKAFGLAAANLLEAEVVTADGDTRVANACANPDLFWALKGGGSGFGVVTRLTLRTHDLPEVVGGVFATIVAASGDAYRRLIAKLINFYREALFNPKWGGLIRLQPGRRLSIPPMVFQGLDREQAEAVWRPFFDWVASSPQDFVVVSQPAIGALPGRRFWDPAAYLRMPLSETLNVLAAPPALKRIPPLVTADDRPGAPDDNIFWTGDLLDAGWVVHALQSVWLPASLLEPDQCGRLVDALTAAAGHSPVELQFDKGLAGGRPEAIEAAKNTAMNPAVLDAFALAICGAGGPPSYPGVPGHEPDVEKARRDADAVTAAMGELRKLVPRAASLRLGDGLLRAEVAGLLLGRQLRAP